ncbi:hypothetical protein D9M72_648480 [compost metagenome]
MGSNPASRATYAEGKRASGNGSPFFMAARLRPTLCASARRHSEIYHRYLAPTVPPGLRPALTLNHSFTPVDVLPCAPILNENSPRSRSASILVPLMLMLCLRLSCHQSASTKG